MTPTQHVLPEAIEIAHDSYRRVSADAFYSAFYRRLLASDPSIAPMFAKTDMERQHKVFQHALGLLIEYGRPGNGKIFDRIAERHGSRRGIDYIASFYEGH